MNFITKNVPPDKQRRRTDKNPLKALNFLKKCHAVGGFQEDGLGNYVFISGMGVTPDQVNGFLLQESIMVKPGFKKITISADDYLKLQARYTIPLSLKEVRTILAKFNSKDHSAEFDNNRFAFGPNMTKACKLLRDHSIQFNYSENLSKTSEASAGIDPHIGIIQLSEAEYQRLQANMTEILKKETERNEKYQEDVNKRIKVIGLDS